MREGTPTNLDFLQDIQMRRKIKQWKVTWNSAPHKTILTFKHMYNIYKFYTITYNTACCF